MKVKIGNAIYDSEKEPIMIILEKCDRENIENMEDKCTKYLSYPDSISREDAERFMEL